MFTGLIQGVGSLAKLEGGRLQITQTTWIHPEDPLTIGESIAVNGCCLTLESTGPDLCFTLSEETLRRTALAELKVGTAVNLERAMSARDRFGGHIVQGHVDAIGTALRAREEGNSIVWSFSAPSEYARYLIDKGSVAVDGISLTVVSPHLSGGQTEFDVWVIPHTLAHTNLQVMTPGQSVNLEFDVLAKYVAQLVKPYEPT